MPVTTCLAPHPCAVCCKKNKNAVNSSVFGMVAKGSNMNAILISPPPPRVMDTCRLFDMPFLATAEVSIDAGAEGAEGTGGLRPLRALRALRALIEGADRGR